MIHGYHTIFPIPLGQAASWDPELIEQAARIAAMEGATEGIRWAFAPMVDIARDPALGPNRRKSGRRSICRGDGRRCHGSRIPGRSLWIRLGGCVRQTLAGYGAAEAGRDYNSAWIPEILLREVYLPPFRRIARRAQPP